MSPVRPILFMAISKIYMGVPHVKLLLSSPMAEIFVHHVHRGLTTTCAMGKEPGTQIKCWEICAASLGSAKGNLQSHDYL